MEELRADIENFGMTFSSEEEESKYIKDKTYQYVLQQMQNFVF